MREIVLTKGCVTLVDDEDYELLVLNWLIENPTDFIDACIEAGTLREVESDTLMVTAWCEV